MNKAATVVTDAKGLARKGKIKREKSQRVKADKEKSHQKRSTGKRTREIPPDDLKYLLKRTNHTEQEIM